MPEREDLIWTRLRNTPLILRALRMRLVAETVRVFEGGKERITMDCTFVRSFILVDFEGTAAACIQIDSRYGMEDVIEPDIDGG